MESILPNASPFGVMLRSFRLEAGISQRELAGKIGLDNSNLHRYELGQRSPRRQTIDRIIAELALPAERAHLLRDAAGFTSAPSPFLAHAELVQLAIVLSQPGIEPGEQERRRHLLSALVLLWAGEE